MKVLLEQSNKSLNSVQNDGYLPSGYIKVDESKIHLGRDVWISTDCYYLTMSNIRSNAVFVKNLAVAVFGEKLLTKCTLSGRGSNRNKQTKKPEGGKLDQRKVLAIKDFYRYWLMTERGMDNIQADMEALNTFHYIRKKISDMKTVPRGDRETRGETQEEERESYDENEMPEEVQRFAQSLNED
ncbi:uncharacterized protein [Temnothorax nylanderi]|uniref:uncharacterized protein n=1 Tax=Temnothorax nylanderi TaxID=102681 RepID=UPI003A86C587